jgi:hypothetical protein
MAIKKIKLNEIKNSSGTTSKEEVDSLTDAKINEAVLSDPDAVVLTDEELEELEKVGIKDKPRGKQ